MFKEGQKIFYVDTREGIIETARFIEKTSDGTWIRIDGHAINTFVYSDYQDKSLFEDLTQAETGLENYKINLKSRLLKNNFFIKDILLRLEKHEGKLYVDVVSEILNNRP